MRAKKISPKLRALNAATVTIKEDAHRCARRRATFIIRCPHTKFHQCVVGLSIKLICSFNPVLRGLFITLLLEIDVHLSTLPAQPTLAPRPPTPEFDIFASTSA